MFFSEQEVIHPTFLPFLEKNRPFLNSVRQYAINCNPSPGRILRFAQNDLMKMKVVVLGQDPYPAKGLATGRAFEVGGLSSWTSPFRQVSLKNIVRAIYCAYTNNDPYETSYRDVLSQMDLGRFSLLPPDSFFSHTESHGVLWLNAALTCPAGQSRAHQALWLPFTRSLLSFMVQKKPGLCFFLWGNDAASFLPFLSPAKTYVSRHPMLCSKTFPDDFLKNPCFGETKALIPWAALK